MKQFKVTDKPWGNFKQFTHNEVSTVKILTVEKNQRLSKQYHHHREEVWVALDDGIVVEINGVESVARAGQEFFIPRGAHHRLSGGATGGRILEVSFGEFDENDIVRLEDMYGRK